jgi:tRNA(fMet)-specific endonuclease VapC
LLDTNIWIVFLRSPHSPVVSRLRSKRPAEIRVCSIVMAELYYGCRCSAKPVENRAKIDLLLSPYLCLPFDEVAADRFAQIRQDLEQRGTPIGPYDLQIAAIAQANGCTLVTNNTAEFSRILGLPLEDWTMP